MLKLTVLKFAVNEAACGPYRHAARSAGRSAAARRSMKSPRAFSKQNAKGAGPRPAPLSLYMSAIVHMPALISVCSAAAFAASFCCSAAAMLVSKSWRDWSSCCMAWSAASIAACD
jgi:hypothetical protein